MSFLKKLFGGGDDGGDPGVPKVLGEENYNGFVIRAIEMKSGSEFQLCGHVEKVFGGETKCCQFVRADKLSTSEQLVSAALAKGKQIVDERGDALFESKGW